MNLDFSPLDRAIASGVVPAADRGIIVETLAAVPESRRQRTLDDIVESYSRARNYLENVRGIIRDKHAKKVAEAETRRAPATEKRPKRSRSEKYAEDLLRMEHAVETKLNPKALAGVFKGSPKEMRASIRRLLDRVAADIEAAKEALK